MFIYYNITHESMNKQLHIANISLTNSPKTNPMTAFGCLQLPVEQKTSLYGFKVTLRILQTSL